MHMSHFIVRDFYTPDLALERLGETLVRPRSSFSPVSVLPILNSNYTLVAGLSKTW